MTAVTPPVPTRRPPRPWLRAAGVLVVVGLPVLEIWLLIQLAGWIGGWLTLLVVVLGMVLGVVLARREGRRAWADLRAGVQSGQPVSAEIAHGGLVLLGGLALIVPGLLTDLVGLLLLLPPTRALAVRGLNRWAENRMRRAGVDVDVLRARMDRGNTVEGETVPDAPDGASRSRGRAEDAGGAAGGPVVIRGEIED